MPVNTISFAEHNAASKSTSLTSTPATKPVFFWKPNSYLSQWYWSEFTVDGDTYKTAEMWMMVQKARLFKDEKIAKQMLATTKPHEHKALGRKVKGFNERVWDQHKLQIVTQGNYHKFTISVDAENLRKMLLATGERELVEASPTDRVWGIGFVEREAERMRHKWGQNLLGKALVEVRGRLRAEVVEKKKEEEAKEEVKK